MCKVAGSWSVVISNSLLITKELDTSLISVEAVAFAHWFIATSTSRKCESGS